VENASRGKLYLLAGYGDCRSSWAMNPVTMYVFLYVNFASPSSSVRLMDVGPAIATWQWLQRVLSWTISIAQHLSQLLMI
jgi:hypothetical protein